MVAGMMKRALAFINSRNSGLAATRSQSVGEGLRAGSDLDVIGFWPKSRSYSKPPTGIRPARRDYLPFVSSAMEPASGGVTSILVPAGNRREAVYQYGRVNCGL